jgi:hypothetical protein
MATEYVGRAAVRPAGRADGNGRDGDDEVRVEMTVSVRIDDVTAPAWTGSIVAAGEFASFLERRVRVVLLAGAERGLEGEATVEVMSPTEVRLQGVGPFA